MIAKFEIPNSFVLCGYVVLAILPASAQFHTITRDTPFNGVKPVERVYMAENKEMTTPEISIGISVSESDSITVSNDGKALSAHPVTTFASHKSEGKEGVGLPELTISNLLAEIKRNNIRYPRIVLAQAILETGWFRSAVCRNKHNLFGLTNPRTGQYYEFAHWTESVRAYYTKVQYRYKGGNYLLWLKKIGYAEDPGYIRAVIKVLKQL